MVQKSLGNIGRYLNEEWHETRHEARTETLNINQWGRIDQTAYDLDTVDFDRKRVAWLYETSPRIDSEGGPVSGFDVRDLPNRD